MKRAERRKTSPKLALRLARAQLRELRRFNQPNVGVPSWWPEKSGEPARFIQCWAVSGRPVTQALDSSGQVWERVWRKATDTTPEQSWWEPMSMERRKKEPHP